MAPPNILEVQARQDTGKGAARRLRMKGLIPAVIYGRHLEKPVQVSVDPKAIRAAINTSHKLNSLITIKVGGKDQLVLLKDYQQDPVTRDLLHADFIGVKENEQVKVKVPLVLVGKAIGVAEGGILSQARRDLEVYALPNAIPEKIEADVTNLKVAEALHINDVKMPAGVTVKSNINYTVAIVAIPDKEEVVVVAAAAAPVAGAPGAPAAAGAAGAAPAAGAAAPAAGAAAPAAAKGDKKK